MSFRVAVALARALRRGGLGTLPCVAYHRLLLGQLHSWTIDWGVPESAVARLGMSSEFGPIVRMETGPTPARLGLLS